MQRKQILEENTVKGYSLLLRLAKVERKDWIYPPV